MAISEFCLLILFLVKSETAGYYYLILFIGFGIKSYEILCKIIILGEDDDAVAPN